uniref:Uncharacterized protein n=1 Tax=Arundo donax TaxID=35708 RepID=A0A0A9E464_ARUDO
MGAYVCSLPCALCNLTMEFQASSRVFFLSAAVTATAVLRF